MKIQSVLNEGFNVLSGQGVETAMLDATVLLAEALCLTKEKLYMNLNENMDLNQYHIFKTYLELRCTGNPVSYIRKKKEFFGIDFFVDNRVLVPRPETELLVETVLNVISGESRFHTLHDLCTGSGCIAIVLKSSHPEFDITASDISPLAAEVFRINCRKILGFDLPFTLSDLFTAIMGKFDIITANPPYIKNQEYEEMKRQNWPEPELALRGGKDGLQIAARIVKGAGAFLNPGGWLVMEAAYDSMADLGYLLKQEGFGSIAVKRDLGHNERVIMGRWD